MCLCNPGNEVIALDPVYATYPGAVSATGADLKVVPLHMDQGPRLHRTEIKAALSARTRVLLINSTNNPAGLMPNSA